MPLNSSHGISKIGGASRCTVSCVSLYPRRGEGEGRKVKSNIAGKRLKTLKSTFHEIPSPPSSAGP